MEIVKIKRNDGFFQDTNPRSEELQANHDMQFCYYHIEDKGCYVISPEDHSFTYIIYVLEGMLKCTSGEHKFELNVHESVLLSDITSSFFLTAVGDVRCFMLSTPLEQKISDSNQFMDMIQEVENNDVYTHGHSRRVCFYSTALAFAYDPGYNIISLCTAADLHDIGKINVPLEILQKPGKLTKEEFDVIKKHPMDSYEILQAIDENVARAARQHHERLDGSGYPDGLLGHEICMDAKIIAIADVYDAMTCKRIYNDPMEPAEVVKYLKSYPNWFDQTLVNILEKKVEDGEFSRDGIHEYYVSKDNK